MRTNMGSSKCKWLAIPLLASKRLMQLLALAAAGTLALHEASAQSTAPVIVSATTIAVAPGTETPLGLSVQNEEAVPRQAMLVIRGLSSGARLSEGRPFGPGVWVVPVASASKLMVSVPVNLTGDVTLNVQVATLEGETVTSTQITLTTTSTVSNPGTIQTSAPDIAAPKPLATPEDKATALKLMKKADEYMSNGSIIVARRLYQGAADRGLGEAAFALAQTYDAQQLAKMKALVGVQADPALATKWYGKAKELGYAKSAAQ